MDREELPTLSSSQKRANLSFSISNILHGESKDPGLSLNAKEEHSDADVSEDEELEENTLRVPQVQRSSMGVEPGLQSLQNQRKPVFLNFWDAMYPKMLLDKPFIRHKSSNPVSPSSHFLPQAPTVGRRRF